MNNRVLLRGRDITRRWGGLLALDKVSLDLERGTVHAVIGTNGAGKSTLVNILSGELAASDGAVELLGQDVTGWAQPRRARAGLGRSYQRNTIYPSFTVLENCPPGRASAPPRPWRLWEPASTCGVSAPARVAARVGLSDVLDRPAGLLSHGQKRQLEIAMCLATAPRCCCSTNPGGHGCRGDRTHAGPAGGPAAGPRHPARGARHGRGVPHRRPHHRDGQRLGDRLGYAAGRPRKP